MSEIPLARQIRCVERELRMRRNAFPRWVEQRKIDQAFADDELATMEAVLKTLRGLDAGGQRSLFEADAQARH